MCKVSFVCVAFPQLKKNTEPLGLDRWGKLKKNPKNWGGFDCVCVCVCVYGKKEERRWLIFTKKEFSGCVPSDGNLNCELKTWRLIKSHTNGQNWSLSPTSSVTCPFVCSVIWVWTHIYLFYLVGYNPMLLLFIVLYKLFQLWPLGALLTCSHLYSSTSAPSGTSGGARLFLGFPCPGPGMAWCVDSVAQPWCTPRVVSELLTRTLWERIYGEYSTGARSVCL